MRMMRVRKMRMLMLHRYMLVSVVVARAASHGRFVRVRVVFVTHAVRMFVGVRKRFVQM